MQARASDGIVGEDEDGLFGKPVNDDQDGCEAGRQGELLYEIHQDGIPRLLRDRELFE